MNRLQDIGGAQALLSLGTKESKADDMNQNASGDDKGDLHPQHLEETDLREQNQHSIDANGDQSQNDDESLEDKANQQLNDAVEAAVMRYVGGTLEGNDSQDNERAEEGHTNGEGSQTSGGNILSSENSKRRVHHEEIISHIGDYQWDSFLEENVADFDGPSPKRPRRRRSFVNNNELDTAILGLEAEPTEHDQLVHAAIMGAGELAKQLSLRQHHQIYIIRIIITIAGLMVLLSINWPTPHLLCPLKEEQGPHSSKGYLLETKSSSKTIIL